ncbi:MAG: class I SAM-dependent methyltransferase [Balneolaceae bacterium]
MKHLTYKKQIWKVQLWLNSILPGNLKRSYQSLQLRHLEIYSTLKDKRILIIGTGKGKEIPNMFRKGALEIVGVDPSPVIKESHFNGNFHLIESEGESLPLEDNSFDITYSIATLEHVRDPGKVISEMARVLKSGGILYCQAGPLWYGFQGFHNKPEYPLLNQPWFHLLHSKEEIIEKLGVERNEQYKERLDTIYNSNSYNRLPSKSYQKTCAWLTEHFIPLEIDFRLSFSELEKFRRNHPGSYKILTENYDLNDLLLDSFTWVFQKN